MLFSEIYGSYFNVVAAVLSEASAGCLTDRRMTELIQAEAFAESIRLKAGRYIDSRTI